MNFFKNKNKKTIWILVAILVIVLIIIFYPIIRDLLFSPEKRVKNELRRLRDSENSEPTIPTEGYDSSEEVAKLQAADALKSELRALGEPPEVGNEPVEGYNPNQDADQAQAAAALKEELRKLKEQEQN